MKSKQEIEQLANEYSEIGKDANLTFKEYTLENIAFINGYTQCQEDMTDYVFEIAKAFHRLAKYNGHTSDTHFTDVYEETINSLNKQG